MQKPAFNCTYKLFRFLFEIEYRHIARVFQNKIQSFLISDSVPYARQRKWLDEIQRSLHLINVPENTYYRKRKD